MIYPSGAPISIAFWDTNLHVSSSCEHYGDDILQKDWQMTMILGKIRHLFSSPTLDLQIETLSRALWEAAAAFSSQPLLTREAQKKSLHRKMLLETNQLAGETQDITYYSGSSLREGKKQTQPPQEAKKEKARPTLYFLYQKWEKKLCIQKKRTADRTMLPWNECALATEHNTQTLALDWGCPKERDKKKAPQFFDSPQSRHSYCLSLSLSLSLSLTHTHTQTQRHHMSTAGLSMSELLLHPAGTHAKLLRCKKQKAPNMIGKN